jgi:hypothetical protein
MFSGPAPFFTIHARVSYLHLVPLGWSSDGDFARAYLVPSLNSDNLETFVSSIGNYPLEAMLPPLSSTLWSPELIGRPRSTAFLHHHHSLSLPSLGGMLRMTMPTSSQIAITGRCLPRCADVGLILKLPKASHATGNSLRRGRALCSYHKGE